MRPMLRLLFMLWVAALLTSVAQAADPPFALCNDVTVEADAECVAMASINDGSYDPGGDPVTIIQIPAGPYPLGETEVMMIVIATSGLADTCVATVTVVDTTPPLVTCPADIVVSNDPGQCGASVSYDITATDNCSITSPMGKQRASFYPVGTTIITPLVTDASGNEGTCSFKVIVKDTELPAIDCPLDIVQSADPDMCGAVVDFSVSGTDNCPGVQLTADPPSGSVFPLGMTTVWIKAVDASGNADSCFFTVTINDVVKPAIECPGTLVLDNDPGECGAILTYDITVTDNCDPNPVVVFDPPAGTFASVGMHEVRVIATDMSGNADTCVFTIDVRDVERPTITCPGTIEVNNDPGMCGAVVSFFDIRVSDNCGVLPEDVFTIPPVNTMFPIGETEVKAIIFDAAGNSDTCGFLVIVHDTEKPIAVCPANIQQPNDPGECGAAVSFQTDGFDNCPVGINVVADPPSGSFFSLGTTPVSVVATDASGLADTCTFDVTIVDTEVPTVVCPNDTVVVVDPIASGAVVEFTVLADDNCPGVSLVVTPDSGSFFPIGITHVVAVATDAVGLTDSCTFTVEVKTALNPDYAIDATPDTLYATEGISDSLLYWIELTDIDGFVGVVSLGVGGVPSGTVLNFGSNPVNVPGMTTLGGHTDVSTPAGVYELTISTSVAPPPKDAAAHETSVWLIVNPCEEEPIPVVSQDLFDLEIEQGDNLPSDSVFITNDAICGTLNWIAASDRLWVTPNPDQGSVGAGETPGSLLHLVYNTSTLDTGLYTATVMIEKGIVKSPGTPITINLTVKPKPAPYCISGAVRDVHHDPISNATVELYDIYPPSGSPIATTLSGLDGSYEFCLAPGKPAAFTVRAYKDGYYPDYKEANFPETDLILTLLPNAGIVTPTYEWVDLYCKFFALFEGAPVLPGSVIEAFDPQGVLCGQWNVTKSGTYGFMPVYRDDPYSPAIDDGAEPGDLITLKVNGYVATMTNGPIHWGENGDRYEACFDVTPVPPYHCIALDEGWNLISWNIDTQNDSIMILAQDVMDNVDVILGFEQVGLTYDPLLPRFSTLLYADHLHGFWFRMNAPDTLCLEGIAVAASTSISLEMNWNLVSYLPMVPYPVPTALASIFDKVIVVLGYDHVALTYDPAFPGFSNLTEMAPDFGYWIKTTGPATLIYPEPGPIFFKTAGASDEAIAASRVAVSNVWVNLYGSDVMLNGSALPVGAVIEAYDASGALVGETMVREVGSFGFMPVYGAEVLSGEAAGKSAGSIITLKVNGEIAKETITWTENGDRIRVNELTTAGKTSSNLPVSFALNQNYPNPFNPETAIDYVVPTSGHVELAVYNVLGDKIKTLVSGYQVAGSYTVKWHADSDAGTTVASGVYFYKLTAGDFTDTKKMTLLK